MIKLTCDIKHQAEIYAPLTPQMLKYIIEDSNNNAQTCYKLSFLSFGEIKKENLRPYQQPVNKKYLVLFFAETEM